MLMIKRNSETINMIVFKKPLEKNLLNVPKIHLKILSYSIVSSHNIMEMKRITYQLNGMNLIKFYLKNLKNIMNKKLKCYLFCLMTLWLMYLESPEFLISKLGMPYLSESEGLVNNPYLD